MFPEPVAIKAFVEATHPMQLVNYGNRAWCRLEVYVFSCLVEITGREITCFAYGLHMPKLKAGAEISEELMVTGTDARGARRFIGCLGAASRERLVPLFGHTDGALFAKTYMPSSGDLTIEHDRETVRSIETIIQRTYSTFAIKNEIQRLTQRHNPSKARTSSMRGSPGKNSLRIRSVRRSMSRSISRVGVAPNQFGLGDDVEGDSTNTRVCRLASKQIHDVDIGVLTEALELDGLRPRQLRKLVLRDNMLTKIGLETLIRDYLDKNDDGGRCVETLDIGGNPIGSAGAVLLGQLLEANDGLGGLGGLGGGEGEETGGGNDHCSRSPAHWSALKRLSLASTDLGREGVMVVASWLAKASELVQLDLRGNGRFGKVAMEALIRAVEAHGRVDVMVDEEGKAGLSKGVVVRFTAAMTSNFATRELG